MSKAMEMDATQLRKKALVHVLGCKVNQSEAAAMAEILRTRGYDVDPATEDPDIVLVNTCCVTSRAEAKSRRIVGRLAERFPAARLIVTGCMAEVNPSALEAVSGNASILGTYEKDRFPEFVEQACEGLSAPPRTGAHSCTVFNDMDQTGIAGRARALLKIQDGCSQRCAYCIVPLARGRSRSLPQQGVKRQARRLCDRGFREIVLTGVHLGHYGRDLQPSCNLEAILEEILEDCPEVRFRISSIEPQEITPRLIDLLASHPRVCRHLHIPLQSADDRILARMRRPYDSGLVAGKIEAVLSAAPDACIGLDIMVGFPGEYERSFRDTAAFATRCGAAYLHVFPFSPRPGTPAAAFEPKVPVEVSQSRVEELRAVSTTLRRRFYERFVGRTLTVVRESEPDDVMQTIVARTDNYIPVVVSASSALAAGNMFSAKLTVLNGQQVEGVPVAKS